MMGHNVLQQTLPDVLTHELFANATGSRRYKQKASDVWNSIKLLIHKDVLTILVFYLYTPMPSNCYGVFDDNFKKWLMEASKHLNMILSAARATDVDKTKDMDSEEKQGYLKKTPRRR